jgi:hypothetical protein
MSQCPTMHELDVLARILRKATHRNVADALLKGFMWACWPEWYELPGRRGEASAGLHESPFICAAGWERSVAW